MSKINLPLLAILFLALTVRLIGIQSRPIWYDEAFAILFAGKGLSAMLYGTLATTGAGSADIHPLGYYTFLWLWMNLLGDSVVTARLFSILSSLISLFLVYKIALALFNKDTATASAAIFAILPFQIHYAQEIRMYAMLSLWLLLATLSFLRARSGNGRWWILFSIASALAQYTHNLAAVYLIPLALTPILQRDWKTLRSLIAAGLVSIILYLPWLIHLPSQFSKVSASYWVERPGVEKIFTLFLFYLPHLPLTGVMLVVGLLAAVLVISLAAFQTYLAKKNDLAGASWGAWTAYLAFAPPSLLWLASQFVPVYVERALLPSHAIFGIWLAWAFTQTRPPHFIRFFAAGLIVVSAGMGMYQHAAYEGFPYGSFSELNQSLRVRIEAGDVILHSSKLSYLPAFYFDPPLPQGFIVDPPGSSVDTLAPATREILNVSAFSDIEQATSGAARVWFVIFRQSIDEYTSKGYPSHPHLEYLDKRFDLYAVEEWDDIRVYLYVLP